MAFTVKINNDDHWYTDSLQNALEVQAALIAQCKPTTIVSIHRTLQVAA